MRTFADTDGAGMVAEIAVEYHMGDILGKMLGADVQRRFEALSWPDRQRMAEMLAAVIESQQTQHCW